MKKQGEKCNGEKCKDQKTEDRFDDFVILAHAAYGWMPRILRIGSVFFDNKKEILEAVDGLSSFGSSSCNEEKFEEMLKKLKIVAGFTNNSFVGASKFLHFIYPNLFAIWDSKICKVLQKHIQAHSEIKNANDMRGFICYQLAMQKAANDLENIELRAIESVLFDSAKDRPSTSDDE